MDDKIYGLMIEWCETPCNKRAGCAYKDLCVVYDSQEGNIMFVQPSHALKLALLDPVLQAAACLDCFFLFVSLKTFAVYFAVGVRMNF